jgi:hypothetical protein
MVIFEKSIRFDEKLKIRIEEEKTIQKIIK